MTKESLAAALPTSVAPHRLHPSVLREYDIRGIVGETLFPDDALAIGHAFGALIASDGGRRVCVGRDGRLSSPQMHAMVVEGIARAGVDVLDIGLGPTPMLYFAVHHLDADGGIQITGSHNPPNHNGFKMMAGKASLYGERIQRLGAIVSSGGGAPSRGSVERVDVFESYVDRLLRDFSGGRPLAVVWDAGNGAAGEVMQALTERMPGRHHCLFAEIDGRFPNHHPDPTVPENLEALISEVRDGGYEVGIAFDGDGDRIGLVDGHGRILFGDQMLQILAVEVLEAMPGATIIADVKASRSLFERIAELGGSPMMWKTGHSLIKAKMAEVGSPLSGEMSGHIFYGHRFYGHDDALYVAVRMLGILARGDRTLAQWRDAMPEVVNTPELRFDCPDDQKFQVIDRIRNALLAAGADVDTTDGVRVSTPEGWWLLRASNTQAVLVARAEASDQAGLARLREVIRAHLVEVGVIIPPGL